MKDSSPSEDALRDSKFAHSLCLFDPKFRRYAALMYILMETMRAFENSLVEDVQAGTATDTHQFDDVVLEV